ncbi:cytidine deaminase [Nonlabens ponticola]|uniref:Cytidine deaminase n=1 Tax=Nonlabens ponticola TaxID=2496866 RepID=A0A3S9MWW1_9FLAO|nr:cytidine deaminase [Nonlabens ponticola]AZQ43627.1 cytidine deaminase [Nonlabens ponticola]
MKKLELHTVVHLYDDIDELDQDSRDLMKEAIVARSNAYAPYSKFTVGCAIKLDDGTIIHGNNQENAAYPSGLCAERVAIFAAGANHPGKAIVKMAITASGIDNKFTKPVPPCGACRQSIAEYEMRQQQPLECYFMGASGNIAHVNSHKELLPLAFDKKYL